jgi:hypothetical protein
MLYNAVVATAQPSRSKIIQSSRCQTRLSEKKPCAAPFSHDSPLLRTISAIASISGDFCSYSEVRVNLQILVQVPRGSYEGQFRINLSPLLFSGLATFRQCERSFGSALRLPKAIGSERWRYGAKVGQGRSSAVHGGKRQIRSTFQ